MGRDLAERYAAAARVFEQANETLGFDLRRLCFEGPEEELRRTANTQPALLATSLAALAAAREAIGPLAAPACVAGHSLGEFTALVAADVLDLADALRLVRRRGELMQDADPSGAMLVVIGLDADAIARAIDGTGWVIANHNAPGQIVVAGPQDSLDRAAGALASVGAKRTLRMRLGAAFHSPAMRSVGDALALEMAPLPFRDARVAVVTNVDAEPHRRAADFPALLARQAYSPVRWVASVRRMEGERVDRFVEFGAGTVLTGLIKRIAPAAHVANVHDARSLGEAAAVLR